MSHARHPPPVPVMLVALTYAAIEKAFFDPLPLLCETMPAFMNAVRQGRIDGAGPAESIFDIAETVEAACEAACAGAPQIDAQRQRLRAVLEAADLDAEEELLDVRTPAVRAGFLTGVVYCFAALRPEDVASRRSAPKRPPPARMDLETRRVEAFPARATRRGE